MTGISCLVKNETFIDSTVNAISPRYYTYQIVPLTNANLWKFRLGWTVESIDNPRTYEMFFCKAL